MATAAERISLNIARESWQIVEVSLTISPHRRDAAAAIILICAIFFGNAIVRGFSR